MYRIGHSGHAQRRNIVLQNEEKKMANNDFNESYVELVSKELNHLVAILHVYTRGLIFVK